MAKKKTFSKNDIITLYMHYVLEHGQNPKSVFTFSKLNNFKESLFYEFFGSFESDEAHIFEAFFTNSLAILNKNKDYQIFDARNKLLSFYFTFFENLTSNRSYVKYVENKYKNGFKGLEVLQKLKSLFTVYISELEIQMLDLKNDKLGKFQNKTLQESAWLQLLLTIKFWLDDVSPSFEKTDIFIEKSVNTTFDVLDTSKLKSVLDLGKFIFKEKFQNT